MVSGKSSYIIKHEKVSSDFPKQELLLAFVKTVSMVQRVLEPEGGRVRNVEEENRVRQVFQKFGGEEKVGVLSIKNLKS